MRTVLSKEAVSRDASSGEKEALCKGRWCSARHRRHSPEVTSQTRALQSIEAVTNQDPVVEKTTEFTTPVCPMSALANLPVLASQSLACQSREAVATKAPSGEKQTDLMASPCPDKIFKQSPVEAHQTAALVPSAAPTMRRPSCEKLPETIRAPSGGASRHTKSPISTPQISASPDTPTSNNVWPGGAKAAERTLPSSWAINIFLASPFCGRQIRAAPPKGAETCSKGVRTRKTTSPSRNPTSFKMV
mmetsp:Transcript_144904/g.361417  ORF Transcript_144904/g.361417 Transcript_144904/m.361417 type:complete len:247 (-) Transcript_144904:173-913(-)